MPFTNPIVAGTTLIRTAISSPNYVAGISGWTINKDGSAELNDVTSRGSLYVSDAQGRVIRIYNDPFFGSIITFRPESAHWNDNTDLLGRIGAGVQASRRYGTMVLTSPTPDDVTYSPLVAVLQSEPTDGVPYYGFPFPLPMLDLSHDLHVSRHLQVEENIIWGPATAKAVTVESTDGLPVTSGTTTSTAFSNITTNGGCTVVFVAPPSGAVIVTGQAGGFNNTVGAYTLLSFEVRSGSPGFGTLFQASKEETASQAQAAIANQGIQHKVSGLVTGLTPGTLYQAVMTYRVTAGTGGFNRRLIRVEPTFG